MIYHISALTEQGSYEFDVPSDNESFAEQTTAALAEGAIIFETIGGERVMLNSERLIGVIISTQAAEIAEDEA